MYPRILLLFVLLATCAVQAQSPPAKECGLKSIQTCALHVAQDELGIVTFPFHMTGYNLAWIAPFGAGTAIALEKDTEAMQALGVNPSRENQFARISDYGGIYGPAAAVTVGYLAGRARHDDHLQEASVLTEEAMADSFILNTALGYAIDRQKPMQGDGTGRFWPHGKRTWPDGQSMPSDHSILAWSFAHVVASEYDGIGTKALVYSLATTVSVSRVIARQHFPSDVFVGAGLGYFIGGYVYHRRSPASSWDKFSMSPVSTSNGTGIELSYYFTR